MKFPKLTILITVMAIIMAASGTYWLQEVQSPPSAARAAMRPFDPTAPGRGLDLYRNMVEEHAMAYGLYASTASMLGMEKEARTAADWLLANPASKLTIGWGLPFAWDAFGDGSTNPETTIYGVTTALAVRGLLDVFEMTGEEAYLRTAAEALDAYKPNFHETTHGGFFGYSNQPSDQIDTHNISGILMGQYARASLLFPNRGYREIAEKAKNHLDASRHTFESSHYWSYSIKSSRVNDLVHASYIVQGYLDYARYLDPTLDLSRELGHLNDFLEGDDVREFPRNADLPAHRKRQPARAWGVGMLIYTLADGGKDEAARKAVHALQQYEREGNIYGTTPQRSEFVPRVQSHVAFGLARFELIKMDRTQVSSAHNSR